MFVRRKWAWKFSWRSLPHMDWGCWTWWLSRLCDLCHLRVQFTWSSPFGACCSWDLRVSEPLFKITAFQHFMSLLPPVIISLTRCWGAKRDFLILNMTVCAQQFLFLLLVVWLSSTKALTACAIMSACTVLWSRITELVVLFLSCSVDWSGRRCIFLLSFTFFFCCSASIRSFSYSVFLVTSTCRCLGLEFVFLAPLCRWLPRIDSIGRFGSSYF